MHGRKNQLMFRHGNATVQLLVVFLMGVRPCLAQLSFTNRAVF
jgi:hypothetical protein